MAPKRPPQHVTHMPPVDLRTGTPMDSDLGVKSEAELPDAALPVYQGENVKAKQVKPKMPLTPEQMAVMVHMLRQQGGM